MLVLVGHVDSQIDFEIRGYEYMFMSIVVQGGDARQFGLAVLIRQGGDR